MNSAIEYLPPYAQPLADAQGERLLTFESDGAPTKREFAAMGLKILNAWAEDPRAWVEVVNGNLFHHAPCGTSVFVIVAND